MIFFASLASGAHTTLFWLVSAAINSTIIATLSFWRGDWEKSRLELICFLTGIVGVIIWYITHEAFYSVYIGCLVDVIAILPTVRKVWRKPSSEPILAWSMGFLSAILNIIAIDTIRAVISVPPFTVLFWHLLILTPMYRDTVKVTYKI